MTASLAGYLASAGAPLYSAAKHGVVGYMRALKQDCAKVGIAISVIAPGITLTPIILGRRTGQTLDEWGKDMGSRGVPDQQRRDNCIDGSESNGARCESKWIRLSHPGEQDSRVRGWNC